MKTQTNFSSLRRTGLTLLSLVFITSLSAFAGKPESDLSKLDNFINKQTRMLKYVPASMIESEVKISTARLDDMFNTSDASLKYIAPQSDENAEVNSAVERLDNLASKTQNFLKYQAPAEDETIAIHFELESLDSLVAATDYSLKYSPSVEQENFDYITDSNSDMVADLN